MKFDALKILLVDDQAAIRLVLSKQLRQLGHQVIEAEDAASALARFSDGAPDVVLMDVVLPDQDGYWAARQIRAQDTGDWTPIIFLSSRDADIDLVRGIDAGGDDYLVKPVTPMVLQAKLMAMHRICRMRAQLMASAEELRAANERLAHLSTLDELTQLGNRRAFEARLADALQHCRREGHPLSLILCDVDHFKRYNDHYGHLEGDRCLQFVAHVLRSVCQRPLDVATRYGGEEFALILPNTPKSGAMIFAKGLHKLIREQSRPHVQSPLSIVTLSSGITTVVPDEGTDAQHLVLRADEALYRAKAMGRNQCYSFELLAAEAEGCA